MISALVSLVLLAGSPAHALDGEVQCVAQRLTTNSAGMAWCLADYGTHTKCSSFSRQPLLHRACEAWAGNTSACGHSALTDAEQYACKIIGGKKDKGTSYCSRITAGDGAAVAKQLCIALTNPKLQTQKCTSTLGDWKDECEDAVRGLAAAKVARASGSTLATAAASLTRQQEAYLSEVRTRPLTVDKALSHPRLRAGLLALADEEHNAENIGWYNHYFQAKQHGPSDAECGMLVKAIHSTSINVEFTILTLAETLNPIASTLACNSVVQLPLSSGKPVDLTVTKLLERTATSLQSPLTDQLSRFRYSEHFTTAVLSDEFDGSGDL